MTKETQKTIKSSYVGGREADWDMNFFELTLISITNPHKINSESPEFPQAYKACC